MAEPFSIPGLLDGGWLSAAFGPFRDGVDICVLVAGALIVNTKDSRHSVWSEDGCVVLIQWTQPVEIIVA